MANEDRLPRALINVLRQARRFLGDSLFRIARTRLTVEQEEIEGVCQQIDQAYEQMERMEMEDESSCYLDREKVRIALNASRLRLQRHARVLQSIRDTLKQPPNPP